MPRLEPIPLSALLADRDRIDALIRCVDILGEDALVRDESGEILLRPGLQRARLLPAPPTLGSRPDQETKLLSGPDNLAVEAPPPATDQETHASPLAAQPEEPPARREDERAPGPAVSLAGGSARRIVRKTCATCGVPLSRNTTGELCQRHHTGGEAWGPEDDARLEELCGAGRTNADVAVALGRTEYAIERRLAVLRKRGREIARRVGGARPGPRVWTPERDAELVRLRAGKLSFPKIAARMGMAVRAVSMRAHHLRKAGVDVVRTPRRSERVAKACADCGTALDLDTKGSRCRACTRVLNAATMREAKARKAAERAPVALEAPIVAPAPVLIAEPPPEVAPTPAAGPVPSDEDKALLLAKLLEPDEPEAPPVLDGEVLLPDPASPPRRCDLEPEDIPEIDRLAAEGLGIDDIAAQLGLAREAVAEALEEEAPPSVPALRRLPASPRPAPVAVVADATQTESGVDRPVLGNEGARELAAPSRPAEAGSAADLRRKVARALEGLRHHGRWTPERDRDLAVGVVSGRLDEAVKHLGVTRDAALARWQALAAPIMETTYLRVPGAGGVVRPTRSCSLAGQDALVAELKRRAAAGVPVAAE